MARLDLSIFSFDRRLDFQSGYIRQSLHSRMEWNLSDLLANIDSKNFGYQEFGVDLDYICVRINGKAIFENISLKALIDAFGRELILEPISKKYVKKDLLVDFDLVLVEYYDFFRKMDFIHPSEQYKLKEFLPLNFIIENSEGFGAEGGYYGDGFMLYMQWLLDFGGLTSTQKEALMREIGRLDIGIFNHISTASSLMPANDSVDVCIESLQSNVLHKDLRYKNVLHSLESRCDNDKTFDTNFEAPKSFYTKKLEYIKDNLLWKYASGELD